MIKTPEQWQWRQLSLKSTIGKFHSFSSNFTVNFGHIYVSSDCYYILVHMGKLGCMFLIDLEQKIKQTIYLIQKTVQKHKLIFIEAVPGYWIYFECDAFQTQSDSQY